MAETDNDLLTSALVTHPDRAWARALLARARVSQRELARAWGVPESTITKWLRGVWNQDPRLSRALAFCRLTGISIDELAARLELTPLAGHRVELTPVGDPPVPTIRIQPGRKAGTWLFLAHVEVETEALTHITRALDEVAADKRVGRRRDAITAKLAEGS